MSRRVSSARARNTAFEGRRDGFIISILANYYGGCPARVCPGLRPTSRSRENGEFVVAGDRRFEYGKSEESDSRRATLGHPTSRARQCRKAHRLVQKTIRGQGDLAVRGARRQDHAC